MKYTQPSRHLNSTSQVLHRLAIGISRAVSVRVTCCIISNQLSHCLLRAGESYAGTYGESSLPCTTFLKSAPCRSLVGWMEYRFSPANIWLATAVPMLATAIVDGNDEGITPYINLQVRQITKYFYLLFIYLFLCYLPCSLSNESSASSAAKVCSISVLPALAPSVTTHSCTGNNGWKCCHI